MMMKKLEQLKGSIKAANAQAASAEDLADVDLFEEIDMKKFEPEPEDTRPTTPPPSAYPFFTAWRDMSEAEKVHELKLACMDPQVMRLAVDDNIIPPDLEDSVGSYPKRAQGWEAFRAWYTENEEVDDRTEEEKKKKPPKVAAARKVFSRNEADAALTDATVMSAGFPGKTGGTEATIEFRNWYNSNRSVRSGYLAKVAKRLEIVRRATIAMSSYNLPEAAFFQEVSRTVGVVGLYGISLFSPMSPFFFRRCRFLVPSGRGLLPRSTGSAFTAAGTPRPSHGRRWGTGWKRTSSISMR